MRRKYKNIIVPYVIYNDETSNMDFIYKDKIYTKIDDVLKDFIGTSLIYHFEVNNELKEVYDMEDVLKFIITDYNSFKIPNKYKNEYTLEEYRIIEHMLDVLSGKKVVNVNKIVSHYDYNKKRLTKEEKRWKSFTDEMKQYDYDIPKIVYSNVFNREVYAYKGEGYFYASYVLEESTLSCFYYQFDGDGIKTSDNHAHEHLFNDVILDMFRTYGIIKIYDFQRQFYSKQELNIINLLNKKLEELDFSLPRKEYDNSSFEKWSYYKDNKKYLRLLALNIKDEIEYRIDKNECLKRHKK